MARNNHRHPAESGCAGTAAAPRGAPGIVAGQAASTGLALAARGDTRGARPPGAGQGLGCPRAGRDRAGGDTAGLWPPGLGLELKGPQQAARGELGSVAGRGEWDPVAGPMLAQGRGLCWQTQGTHECWRRGGKGRGTLSPSPLQLFPFLQGGQGSLGGVGRTGAGPPAPPALISPRTTATLPNPFLCFESHLALRPQPTVPTAREPPQDLLRTPQTWDRCPETRHRCRAGGMRPAGPPPAAPRAGVTVPAGTRSRSTACCHPSASGGSDVPGSRHGPGRQQGLAAARVLPPVPLKNTVSFPRGRCGSPGTAQTGSPALPHLRSLPPSPTPPGQDEAVCGPLPWLGSAPGDQDPSARAQP